jgi:hypothetical protein
LVNISCKIQRLFNVLFRSRSQTTTFYWAIECPVSEFRTENKHSLFQTRCFNIRSILDSDFPRPIHDESDSHSDDSSSDTNISSIPEELNTDMNEIHDNNESLASIADGGLASFVKNSSINDDFCKLKF